METTFSHFLFLTGTGVLLLRKKLSEKQFNVLLFLSTLAYLFLFYAHHLQLFCMAGDNICQIAYWKVLFHPHLAGSIGASYTKPGQLLILGVLYELSGIFGENTFRMGLCLIMATCIWILARIATDLGGREAGIVALPVALLAFQSEFLAGSFSIFLVPTLFAGLWLYYHFPRQQTLGRILLASSIQFHILSAPVLGVIWLELLVGRKWRELGRFSLAAAGSLAVWLLLILRIQGSLERISSSGPAVGYIGSFGDSFVYGSTAEYLLKAVWSELSGSYTYAALFILVIIGIIGVWHTERRYYLAIFSIPLLLVANVLLFNGTLNINRYFAVFYGFGCSAGIGSLVLFVRSRFRKLSPLLSWAALIPVLAVAAAISSLQFREPSCPPYVLTARNLLADPLLPAKARLMTEDDLLYPVVALAPSQYPVLTALQRFNTAGEARRRAILGSTDCIWIALTSEHQYYYLDYLPVPSWRSDPFRLMVNGIMTTGTPGSLYGFRFAPLDMNRERLLLQVRPESSSQ